MIKLQVQLFIIFFKIYKYCSNGQNFKTVLMGFCVWFFFQVIEKLLKNNSYCLYIFHLCHSTR